MEKQEKWKEHVYTKTGKKKYQKNPSPLIFSKTRSGGWFCEILPFKILKDQE